ncbi:SpoIID/LytB domain-containing protein [Nocardia panacis]|uniref:SpoIID/LytB domain-containing protein n=1 Tax=Nocardia panacis TaxID=2340916 RepID=A0A3A4KNZ7_9NOCA|nr:SpoIID/LytB domain-containing protein [Nocardia panacis]RJO77087.1 SpoIID/LytB domain-containing protein [Nocardia panacis]
MSGTRDRTGRAGIRLRRRGTAPQPVVACGTALLTGGAVLVTGAALVLLWRPDAHEVRPAASGHGRGMSQVGAFDSAVRGWSAERILDHYYPGAALGTVPNVPVRVRLTAQDGARLEVFAPAGLRVAGRILAADQVAHLTPLPDGRASVVVTAGCAGAQLWEAETEDPWAYPIDPGVSRPAGEQLRLCDGGVYRGALGVALDGDAPRTVNQVEVEDYLLGVVPAEVQANWSDKGGAEAVRAQAIAARSYVLAEHRYPYAQTCDTTDCQNYPGSEKEDARSAAAVAATSGIVLLREGRILRSEYSAAPDGGTPADIGAFEVGPTPAELAAGESPSGTVEPAPSDHPANESPVEAEYRRIGGESSPIGAPLGPEMLLPGRVGRYRLFANGVIIATPTLGAQVVDFNTLLQLVPDASSPTPQHLPAGTPNRTAPVLPADSPRTSPEGAVPQADSSAAPRLVDPAVPDAGANPPTPNAAVPPAAGAVVPAIIPPSVSAPSRSARPGDAAPQGGSPIGVDRGDTAGQPDPVDGQGQSGRGGGPSAGGMGQGAGGKGGGRQNKGKGGGRPGQVDGTAGQPSVAPRPDRDPDGGRIGSTRPALGAPESGAPLGNSSPVAGAGQVDAGPPNGSESGSAVRQADSIGTNVPSTASTPTPPPTSGVAFLSGVVR